MVMEDDGDIVVGLMSGTSMDGIDVCIVKIEENKTNQSCHLKFSILNHSVCDYPNGLKEDLLLLCSSGNVCHVSQYNVLLGTLFGEAVLRAIKEAGLTPQQVKLVGSHGQTVYHQPVTELLHNHNISSTLQIGDISTIANTCGIMTVGDFRLADMACGGQGAPLVPYLDQLLARRHFVNTNRIAVFLNIGGISNIFTINHNNGNTIGFDTGPEYDDQGFVGAMGTLNKTLLQFLIQEDSFITINPPKSSGREYYSTVSIIIGQNMGKYSALGMLLREKFNRINVNSTDAIDIPADCKEALCFAILGYETVKHRPTNLSSVTGATKRVVLGKISPVFTHS